MRVPPGSELYIHVQKRHLVALPSALCLKQGHFWIALPYSGRDSENCHEMPQSIHVELLEVRRISKTKRFNLQKKNNYCNISNLDDCFCIFHEAEIQTSFRVVILAVL